MPEGSAFDYNFILSLKEKEYKKYLKLAYFIKTGKELNLDHPKTLNEKIQWLKLYDNLPIKTQLTDKVLVRDWVKDKIGENYLKPVLWIGNAFDDIPFDNLPDKFVIKCNHGCKWMSYIENKSAFLENKCIFNSTKKIFDGWLSQTFFGWSDFELQYKNIIPKLLIEPLLKDNKYFEQLHIYCFNSKPEILERGYRQIDEITTYNLFDSKFNPINLKFDNKEGKVAPGSINNNLKTASELSQKLAANFKLVRVDWMVFKGKLYFEEMTFTPYSGFIPFSPEYHDWNIKLGNLLNLKGK